MTFLANLCKWLNRFCFSSFFTFFFWSRSRYKRINIFLYNSSTITTTGNLRNINSFFGSQSLCQRRCFYSSAFISRRLSCLVILSLRLQNRLWLVVFFECFLFCLCRFICRIFFCFYKCAYVSSGLPYNGNNVIHLCCFSGFYSNVQKCSFFIPYHIHCCFVRFHFCQ